MIRLHRDRHADILGQPWGRAMGNFWEVFLEQDVQGSLNGCQEYLSALDSVIIYKSPEWAGTGNAHSVVIRPNGVTIVNEWDHGLGVQQYSLAEFKEALINWSKLISSSTINKT